MSLVGRRPLACTPHMPQLDAAVQALGPQLSASQTFQVYDALKIVLSRLKNAVKHPDLQTTLSQSAGRFSRAVAALEDLEQRLTQFFNERRELRDSTNINKKDAHQAQFAGLADELHQCMKLLDSAWRECKPFGLSSKEAVWRNNTMVWLREALAELHGSSTLPPMPEADENVPLAQGEVATFLDVDLWVQERDGIAETKRLRRTIEHERNDCRKQMAKSLEEHAALRRQLREATHTADALINLENAREAAAQDAARLAHELIMGGARSSRDLLIRQMQLDAAAHQLAMDHLASVSSSCTQEADGWEKRRLADVDNLDAKLHVLTSSINEESAELQALQQQLATEWRLKNAHDTRELAKMGAEVARQHAARVIQRAWRLFRTRPRVAAKPTGKKGAKKGGKKGTKGKGKGVGKKAGAKTTGKATAKAGKTGVKKAAAKGGAKKAGSAKAVAKSGAKAAGKTKVAGAKKAAKK